ncbi:MAG: cell wall-binding repeat-containing protein [Acidimicrobiaceae bacterium]|nr:cell wall-binding repeat-containing protein [Acidimicrobiaceae bacterium]
MTWRRSVWLPTLLAALLASGLLALPHDAAHAVVDDAEFTRLSGPTRYSTSVQIAEAYIDVVDELADTPDVDTVIMGSGLDEHAGWVTPVPMLSRLHRAPLVFTRPDDVPVPVAQFLQRRAIRRVILLGGTQVISAAVESKLADLGVQVVERLGSDDIHLHSVAVAASFNNPAGNAARSVRTALLVTSNAFADALAAGPMAYQGDYPILLTDQDRLHPAVLDYLVASDIERLIIVGGTAAVGTAVQQALSGFDFKISRIAGIDRYGTAVKLAEAQMDRRDPLWPCFDGAELGLAYGGLSPDAIASGPLLGELCAPLLLTGSDTLPRSVSSFLRSYTRATGDADHDPSVTVFGGTAVVPTDVVNQIFERRATLVPIGGRISVVLDPRTEEAEQFTVAFEDDIDATKAARALDSDVRMFSVNADPVRASSSGLCDGVSADPDEWCGDVRVLGDSVTVTLDPGHRVLEAGDVITVTGGQRIGSDNSPRPLARFSYTIPDPDESVDRDAPQVEIIAPAGQMQFAVLVIEENPFSPLLPGAAALAKRITVTGADGAIKSVAATSTATSGLAGRAAGTRSSHQRYLFSLADGMLEPGDAIAVPRGVFVDEAGLRNRAQHSVVAEHSVELRIDSVTIGDVDTESPASVTLNANTQLDVEPGNARIGSLTITARRDGFASGSGGNQWRVYGVGLPPGDDEENQGGDSNEDIDPEIGVSLNPTTRLIRYDILRGEPTFADLAEALWADVTFAANFTVTVDGAIADGESIGGTITAGVQFGGAGTAIGVRVRFSDPVKSLLGGATPREPIVAGVMKCSALPLLADIAPNIYASSNDCTLGFAAPDNLVYFKLNSRSATRFPGRGDSVFINGNAASDYTDRLSVTQGWLTIRYDPDVVAN